MRYEKRRFEEIKSKMDEAKFLLSDSYRLFLQKIVHGVTGRYDLKVIFSDGVYTNNKTISVNPVHEYVLRIKRTAKKTLVILGQLAHEIFHIIYTDFRVLKKMEADYRSEIMFRKRQIHECFNIIEDSAVELAGTNYYTGSFRQAIIALNENALKNMPSLDEMAEQGAPRLAIFKQACAMYCILGTMKGRLHDRELIELFEKAIPILDKGRLEPHSNGRYRAAKKLYNLIDPLIQEALERKETEDVEKEYRYVKSSEISSGGSSAEVMEAPEIKEDFSSKRRELTKEELEKMKEESEVSLGSDDTGKESEEDDETSSRDSDLSSGSKDASKKKGDETGSSPGGGDTEEDEEDLDDAPDSGVGGKDKSEKSKSEEKGGGDTKDSDDTTEGSDGEEKGEDGEKDKEDSDRETAEDKSDSESSEKEGSEHEEEEESEDGLDEILDSLEEQLETAFDEAAKEEYDKEEQKEHDRRIREFARTVKFSDLHRHIHPITIRDFDVDESLIYRYNETFEPIKGLARSLTKKMRDIIRYNEDVKTTGLISGKINRNQLYRMDKLVFYKRQEKSDEADLAIVLLVDESGSMRFRGRYLHAKQAAMLLYEVCHAIKIPLAVIGYDAHSFGDGVRHRHYVDFGSRDKREKYKLENIRYYAENRDGYSIKYAGEYLLTRPEEDKILIVITDGQPAHPSTIDRYMGELGISDSGRAVKELEKKGVTVFGLAIGDGKSGIKRIFTKNYIDIPDLKYLPGRLANLIERNLLKE